MRRRAGLAYYDQCTSHKFLIFVPNSHIFVVSFIIQADLQQWIR